MIPSSRCFHRWLSWAALGVVLCLAGSVQFLSSGQKVAVDAVTLAPLTKLLPASLPGWTVEDSSLGQTEGDAQKVQEILQYDDAIFRTYRRGNLVIGVHVVYWRPNPSKTEYNLAHSPDICWPNAGWSLQERVYEKHVTSAGWTSPPGQYRVFEANGKTTEMLFWHLRRGQLSGYMMGDQTRWRARLTHMLEQTYRSFRFGSVADEIFVRITMDAPLEEVIRSDAWAEIAKSLAVTGAFQPLAGY